MVELADVPEIVVGVVEVELDLRVQLPERPQHRGEIVADAGQGQFAVAPPARLALRNGAAIAVEQIA